MSEISIPLLIFVVVVLVLSFYVKIWVRLLFAVYFGIVFFMFNKGYVELHSERDAFVEKNGYDYNNDKDLRALEQFWDEQSAYVDHYSGLIFFPLLIFIVYSYYKLFLRAENRKHRILITLTMIPVAFMGMVCSLFFSMQGYQP